jgi:Zn-dependent M28 family amino/carboxypeptidase
MTKKKIYRNVLFAILFASSFIQVHAQQTGEKDIKECKYIISTLSSDSFKGRLAGSCDEKKAADLIVTLFQKNKLMPFFKNSFRYSFQFFQDSISYTSADLAGMINNNADSTIIFIAHYDHIGLGGPKSRSLTSTKIHPGADDNASGVAALILLSEKLNSSKYKKYNYLYTATGAHESGLWGAKALADSGKLTSLKIKCIINLDMVGRLDTQTKILEYATGNPSFIPESVFNSYADESLKLVKIELPPGDHTPFSDKGFPVLFLTTGSHEDYHKITDTADKINYNGLLLVTRFIEYLILPQ